MDSSYNYESFRPMANKFLNEDGSISTLDKILGKDIDYSLNEVNTGKKWIDGKPIYQKTFQLTTGSSVTVMNDIGTIPNFSNLVDIKGYLTSNSGNLAPHGYSFGTTYNFSLSLSSTGTIRENHLSYAYSNTTCYVTVWYTKSA